MKKILFLSFAYPYGHFDPSDQCSTRVMKALVETGKYEVHNISFKKPNGKDASYPIIDDVITHYLPFTEGKIAQSRWSSLLLIILRLPIYPIKHFWSDWKYYLACKRLIANSDFDLVISQCNPEYSVVTGALLKKNNCIKKLMVIFWDNIYGKLPRRVVPKSYAISRQRKMESWIARYADKMVSLYPLKAFHEKYGDVAEAYGKRSYLGIPSISRPSVNSNSSYKDVIKEGYINILYSGTVFRTDYVVYFVKLMNETTFADKINLIFFCRGVPDSVFLDLKANFKGALFNSGWIPLNDLLGLYKYMDFFVSFPGNPRSICSKVFEYMSYGKPLMILYDDNNDVNVTTFSHYPACLSLDGRKDVKDNLGAVESYLKGNIGVNIDYKQVEKLFSTDTSKAYVDMIEEILTE